MSIFCKGYKMLDKVLEIEKGNNFIQYIIKRIKTQNYRGIHLSQHNRYDFDYVKNIISVIYNEVKNEFFEIPRGDYSEKSGAKKDYNPNDYPIFKKIVNTIKKITNKGTYNSIKKNFFVDFDRAGILERYDKNFKRINSKRSIFYCKLTDKAIQFIQEKDILKQHRIFTDFLDNLFEGLLSDFTNLLYNSNYKNDTISLYEFAFIISDTELSNEEKIKLLDSFRELKRYQKEQLIELIKQYSNLTKNKNKIDKRDFHNWLNETQQIFSLIKQTSYFQLDKNNNLSLNTSNIGIFSPNVIQRSETPKKEYFQLHKINKDKNFELHHIVAISKARNKTEVEMLDNVYNLLYIEKNLHKKITKNKNKHNYLVIDKNIILCDFKENKIIAPLKFIKFNLQLKNKVENYNKVLLKEIFEFDKQLDCNKVE